MLVVSKRYTVVNINHFIIFLQIIMQEKVLCKFGVDQLKAVIL